MPEFTCVIYTKFIKITRIRGDCDILELSEKPALGSQQPTWTSTIILAVSSHEGVSMSNLQNALQQLRVEHKQAQQQMEKLQSAISVIEDLVERNGSVLTRDRVQPASTVSAAARRRMAQAQRARWARVRRESQVVGAAKATGWAPAKHTMSASARRKIAAAQRARWAKWKAQQKKAA